MPLMDIRSANIEELAALMESLREKPFRAKQIFRWIHARHAESFEEMTDLGKDLRARLQDAAQISTVSIAQKQESSVDGTIKYLFAFENRSIIGRDGQTPPVYAEAVLMHHSYGDTVCISSQAGCRMGCKFCASTLDGLARNLTAGEMAGQIYAIARDADVHVTRTVVMGCGEPLDNYDNLLRFLRLMNAADGHNMSHRNITVSTCGLVDNMRRLMKENLQITLAVSLHAPNDSIRKTIMPIANKYPMDDLLAACREYGDRTKRRVTFEYALIAGVNDSVSHAQELAGKLKHMLCHVNLIPVNEIDERSFCKSSDTVVDSFAKALQARNIDVTIRKRHGADIDAACGQLRQKNLNP